MTQKKRGQPEFELQCVIADLLRLCAKPGLYWTALPFGEERPKKQDKAGRWYSPAGDRLARMGCRPGAPDLLLIWQGRVIGVEIKTEKGTQTETQITTERDWEEAGGEYFLVKGYKAAVEVLHAIGCIKSIRGVQRFEPRQEVAA